jgi:hypothetical protein
MTGGTDMSTNYTELLQRLHDEYGVPEELTDKLSARSMRKKLAEKEREIAGLQPAVQELTKLEEGAKRKELFADLGVDFDALRPAEREVIDSFKWDDEEPDRAAAAALISRYQIRTKREN